MEDLGELELDLDVDPGSEDAGAGANIEEKTLLQETHMALQQFSIGKRITYRKRCLLHFAFDMTSTHTLHKETKARFILSTNFGDIYLSVAILKSRSMLAFFCIVCRLTLISTITKARKSIYFAEFSTFNEPC